MQKHSTKRSLILLFTFLLFPFLYFFVACQQPPSTLGKSHTFQEISSYIKEEKGDKFTVFGLENYVYHFNNKAEPYTGIIYSPSFDTLAVFSDYKGILAGILIQNTSDYTNYTYDIVGYHTLNKNTLLKPQFHIALPSKAFQNVQTTTVLPNFNIMDNTIKNNQKEYHANLSFALHTAIKEFNQFFMTEIKAGNSYYAYTVYEHFHLPILQIENLQ